MSLICYKSRPGKQAVPSTFRCREGDTSLKDLQSTLHAPVKLHVGAALSLTSFPRHRELKYPTVHRTCAPRRRQRAKAEVALERHPAARGAACRRVLPAPGSPHPHCHPARSSPDAQGPTQQLRPQNGCRQLRHVTPLCLLGSRTPWDPGTSGRGRRVASVETPPGRGGWGSRPGEAG